MRNSRVQQIGRLIRRGFTLPEVLVTVALVAVLAAVVVPTVANQVKKGDPNRLAQDVTNMRGGIEQFLSDVRKYPASIGQLTNPISTSMKPLATSAATPSSYTAADVARWKGPYLTKDSLASSATGFGWAIQYAFQTDTFATTASFGKATSADTKFLTLRVCTSLSGVACTYAPTSPIDSLSWLSFEQQFDDANSLSGTVRYKSDSGFIKILAMPIQP